MEVRTDEKVSRGNTEFQRNKFRIGPAGFDLEKVHIALFLVIKIDFQFISRIR